MEAVENSVQVQDTQAPPVSLGFSAHSPLPGSLLHLSEWVSPLLLSEPQLPPCNLRASMGTATADCGFPFWMSMAFRCFVLFPLFPLLA